MSAIGGILDLRSCRTDADTAVRMSRAMLSRAACGRGAYCSAGVSLFGQDLFEPMGQVGAQPAILMENGHCYAAVLDGQIRTEGTPCKILYGGDAALYVLNRYLSCGIDLLSSLEGAFALAIWDGYRGELILCRDPLGRKPLFYASEQGRFAFASQIKGLLRFFAGAPVVDTARLREYWLAPCGSVDGSSVYRELEALPAGHCGIFSGLGLTVYPYGAIAPVRESACRSLDYRTLCCPDREGLIRCLEEALFAFDYPAFDDLMPSFLDTLDSCACKGAVAVADPMLFRTIGYAWERADRLGALRGLWVELVPPDSSPARAREQKRMDRLLRELVAEAESPLLDRIFGLDWRVTIDQKRTLSDRIRMRGILYQTLLWSDREAVVFE